MRELRGMPALAAVLLELEGCGEGELITNSTLPPIQFKTYLQHPSIPPLLHQIAKGFYSPLITLPPPNRAEQLFSFLGRRSLEAEETQEHGPSHWPGVRSSKALEVTPMDEIRRKGSSFLLLYVLHPLIPPFKTQKS